MSHLTTRSSTDSNTATVAWLVRRVLLGMLILVLVSVLLFLVTQALPGDVARIVLGKDATAGQVAELRLRLGLDQPLVTQYWDWLTGVLTGEMGTSLQNGEPVAGIIGPRVLNSFTLGLLSMVLILPLAVVIGVFSAHKRDSPLDRVFVAASSLFTALPAFVVGMLLIAFFATSVLGVLPGVSDIPPGDMPWWYPARLVLPVATLTLMGVMYLGRLVRASFIDAMNSEYVQMAVLKGLSDRRILFRHALPNAIAASLPAASLVTAVTITGVVVVEYVYSYPGLGTAVVSAVNSHDLPVMQAGTLILAAAYYVFNLLADLLAVMGRQR
ncbi:ABC transporter permease [Amycolatopsis regifaucium]|uniref:Peptide ABC transporter permease n=1 Tax=Amycolatopsis regifaucium TaxID=546365 RepID=A0A154MNY8_9PSEU|nr:ABC transporter permease [Amycolatopsis regifaucium]KZB86014.1 peptide ABC transporter permease [Amycolatopsis regifaucium]OKA04905.1 peptide ABC transporter permease [Amycolatopsis regifaucium]SFH74837.1 peptide/nickel transport system permease protein [Amycolatopsis regifaucium]